MEQEGAISGCFLRHVWASPGIRREMARHEEAIVTWLAAVTMTMGNTTASRTRAASYE